MQIILTEEEYAALKAKADEAETWKKRYEMGINDNQDVSDTNEHLLDTISEQRKEIQKLRNDVWVEKQRNNDDKVFLGEYPTAMALQIAEVLRGTRSNNKIRVKKVRRVQLHGRGARARDGHDSKKYHQDLPLDKAEKAVVYITA